MGILAVSLKDDAIEITAVVVALALAVWYIESKYQAAGGVTGLSSSLFTGAVGSLFSGNDPTPGLGAIPDQTTLGAANGTMNPASAASSGWLNSLLNSSNTMQSIGM